MKPFLGPPVDVQHTQPVRFFNARETQALLLAVVTKLLPYDTYTPRIICIYTLRQKTRVDEMQCPIMCDAIVLGTTETTDML